MIVDWLSFTVDVPTGWEADLMGDIDELVYQLPDAIGEQNPLMRRMMLDYTWTPRRGQPPYSMGWSMDRACNLYYHPNIPHALIEFTGRGCEMLRERGLMRAMIDYGAERMTRIDVALDIPGVTPDEIIEAGYNGRIRAHSRLVSATGTTHYVGSKASERYCRVYRYNEPHPRHALCRIEAVHRKNYAKILALAIIDRGLERAARSAIASFEFEHEAMSMDSEKLRAVSVDKESAKTLRWLLTQCAPAFRRLVAEGVIEEPVRWLEEHFVGGEGEE